MNEGFYNWKFSIHFNRLSYLGMWTEGKLRNPIAKKLYLLHCFIWHSVLVIAILIELMDLYNATGNMRKIINNMSTSVILVAYPLKIMLMYGRKDHVNGLRMRLWKDALQLKKDEDLADQNNAYKRLNYIEFWFYVATYVFLPAFVISSYFSYLWGPRELPFAMYYPMSNPMSDFVFLPPLIFETICAFYIVFIAIETEMSVFSIILQLQTFHQILLRNIAKLDNIYGDDDAGGDTYKEVNADLKKESAKRLLKESVMQHLKLMEYNSQFEFIFSRIMLMQMLGGSLLIVMNGLELLLVANEISMKLYFQIAYITMLTVDILLLCYHFTELSVQCSNVGDTVYSTAWHKMDADIRKQLCIIMMRAAKPTQITAGKLVPMNLATYLQASILCTLVRGIYSCLMLMRQFIAK